MIVLLHHEFGDMYLRHYLKEINKNDKLFMYVGLEILDKEELLYNYNINNPNSVCVSFKRKSIDKKHEGNLILNILDCKNNNELENIIKNEKVKVKQLSRYIYSFLKLLYDDVYLNK